MITLNFLREHPQEVIDRLKVKNFDAKESVEKILDLDAQRRALQKTLDDNYARQNVIAKQIGQLFKEGKAQEAQSLKEESATLKTAAKDIENQLDEKEKALNGILVLLPNMPHASVPVGKSADDNDGKGFHAHVLPHKRLDCHDGRDNNAGNRRQLFLSAG